MKKTILMISPFARPNMGGVEVHLEKLSRYLVTNSFKVYLLTYQPLMAKARGAKIERDKDLEIHRVTWFGRGLFPILEPYFFLEFIYLFPGLFLKSLFFYLRRHGEVDVIHAHGLVAASITKILAKIHPKKSVVSTHAIYNFTRHRLLALLVKWVLCSFDKILAVGEPSRKELIQIGLPEVKISIHPNWVDLGYYCPLDRDDCRRRLQLPVKDFIVLFVGRFTKYKGIEVLLEVSRIANSNIKFVFIGFGPEADMIKKVSQHQKNVIFIGKIPEEERYKIIEAYNAADLFVAPVQYEEGFATVFLEVIACGTPVVTANRGCLPSFLDSEVADLIEPTVENVAHRIEYYFRNRDQLSKKASACRPYAEDNFSQRNAKVIVNSYE